MKTFKEIVLKESVQKIDDLYYTNIGKLHVYQMLRDLINEMNGLKTDIASIDDDEKQDIIDEMIEKSKKIVVSCEKLIKQNITHDGVIEKIKDYANNVIKNTKTTKDFDNLIKKINRNF